MKIFAISDLHLCLSVNKSMDVFGKSWAGYIDKIENQWIDRVREDDIVLIPGDISWATYLNNIHKDFEFLENLPGKKIISKGNHDYWWETITKMNRFVSDNNYNSITFLHNNSLLIKNISICCARGWKCPGDEDFKSEDEKFYKRELQRLRVSLSLAEKETEILVMMHFPPFNTKGEPSEFIDIMNEFGVKKCVFGHIHSFHDQRVTNKIYKGIEYKLVSSDYLHFAPIELYNF